MSSKNLSEKLSDCLKSAGDRKIQIMEVCGTHTQSIAKSGIASLLPNRIRLLSGPGCPVCVTSESYMDMVISLLSFENIIIATFGDMLKVKGAKKCLEDYVFKRKAIHIVYSPEDIIAIALQNKDKTVVFLAVGFETTAPLIAVLIKNIMENGPENLLFLTSLKRMEPVMRYLLADEDNKIDGIICPGHVSAVLGSGAFRFVTDEYKIPAVICGFTTPDITKGIILLLEQITGINPIAYTNLYQSCVTASGNKMAQTFMEEVFDIVDGDWRGIGNIPDSAFIISKKFARLDAAKRLGLTEKVSENSYNCCCGAIIRGIKLPNECRNFGKACVPQNPLGPCMVSREGACFVHYHMASPNL